MREEEEGKEKEGEEKEADKEKSEEEEDEEKVWKGGETDETESEEDKVEEDMTCYTCLGQCKTHEIKLKRSFNPKTDSFSLAVSGVEFKHQTPPVC